MRLSKAPRRKSVLTRRPSLKCESLEPRQMLSADGLGFTPGVYDSSMIRTSPAAPLTPEFVFVGDQDLGVISEDATLPFVPYEDTFSLHSNPTSPFTIYLDFNGHRTSNTSWNALLEDPLTGQDIDSPPYDIDGDFNTFSDLELENIQEAFLRVAEDFAPFNVNVTTEEPADLDDLRRTDFFDERWGIRVVSGGSTRDWLTPDPDDEGAGGVAFLGSFNDPIDTPAFAFQESGWASGFFLGEVISHEVGHTLGLSHDGLLAQPGWDPDDPEDPRAPVEYFAGQGDWSPIMGGGSGPITQWSQGEYFMASNDQDDLAIIAGPFNGIGYRTDDQAGFLQGGQVMEATELEREPPTTESIFANSVVYKQQGIIEQNTDTDYYEFYSNAGPISIEALPAAIGANLDIKIELLDSSGNVLAVGAPDDDLTASLSTTVFIPDFYTLAITGDASQAEPQPVSEDSTDYTDYGSLGQYAVTISAALGPQPDAYEKNDFLGTAYDAPYADYTFRGSIHQGGDEDFYYWTAGQTGTLKADLRFLHADGDLELEIYDQAGVRIPGAISASGTDDEFLEIDVTANQSYYVRVWSRGVATQDSYELWLDGPGVPLDGFTSRDGTIDLESQFATFEFDETALLSELGPVEQNDTPETAFELRPGPSTGGGSLSDYSLDFSIHRPDDNDFLLWTSPGTGKLILDVGFEHSQANIDVEVRRANLDPEGVVVSSVALPDGVAESTDDNEQVIVDVDAGDAYLIRVYATPTAGVEAPSDALYTLQLDGPEITFDAFELNNTLEQADDSLNGLVGITPNLSIHSPIDADYFRWTAPETGDFRARAFFFHENGDIDLSLLDANGDVVAVSTSLTDNESVTERVIAGRDYFIKVYGFNGATQANYALDLAFAAAPAVPGDFDGNGFVDVLDWDIWNRTYGVTSSTLDQLPEGETTLRADANDDGFVDQADYTIWRDNKGSGREPELASVIADVGKAPQAASFVVSPTIAAPTAAASSQVAAAPIAPPETLEGFEPATGFVPLDQTFSLHSNPDSNFTIYLDFNGHVTADAAWLDQLTSNEPGEGSPNRFGLPFVTPPYDINGDDTFFSTQELFNIQEAFLRVSEDFAPFDVNVTTEEPPIADLQNAGEGDERWGIRVVSGGSTFDWLSWPNPDGAGGAGGVALPNSFSFETDTPTYAFEEGYGGSAKNLAEVISHEVGHTLGLNHDGNFRLPDFPDMPDPDADPPMLEEDEYYGGHENGLWGPIMGAAYVPTVSQWSKGEYFFANRGEFVAGAPNMNFEDDLEIITTVNGFGYRVDDHGNELPEATLLDGDSAGERYSGAGLIETNTDYDYFSFASTPGDVVISASPAQYGPNLDIKLELYNEAGVLIATGAPDLEQSASIAVNLTESGNYYLSVTGDAFKAAPDIFDLQTRGYTDYGSLGQYTLDVVVPPGAIQPDLFELNDDLDTPFDLLTGDQDLNNLTRHVPTDDDVFLWEASADGEVLIDLIFSHATSDLDLEVFAAGSQTLLASSLSSTNNESILLAVDAGQQYLVRVSSSDQQVVPGYSLSIDGPGGEPDIYELNNTPETARPIVGTTLDQGLSLHFVGDQDYVQWISPADDTLRVEAVFDSSAMDLKVQIIDPLTSEVLADSSATASSEVATTDALQGEVYLIRVYSDGTDPLRQVGDYRLLLNGGPITGDALEPNGVATPTSITQNKLTVEDLSIHTATDRDYFTFTPPVTGTWRVDATFIHAFGDLDLELSDPQGVVAVATSATDDETIVARVIGGRTYTLQVFGYQSAVVSDYTLNTLFNPTPQLPGDFNDDGLVGQLDLVLWANSYGRTGPNLPADANDDGVVDAADYTIFRDNEGATEVVAGAALQSSPAVKASDAAVSVPTASVASTATLELALEDALLAGDRLAPSPIAGVERAGFATPDRELLSAREAVADDLDLLLIGGRVESPGDESDEDSDAHEDERSRDDAFAELAVAFDRIG